MSAWKRVHVRASAQRSLAERSLATMTDSSSLGRCSSESALNRCTARRSADATISRLDDFERTNRAALLCALRPEEEEEEEVFLESLRMRLRRWTMP